VGFGVRIAPAAAVLVAVATLPQASCGGGTVVYTNDFNGLAGTTIVPESFTAISLSR
jgi:hypothetical protein